MLDFNASQRAGTGPTPNYFERRVQRKILLRVMLIGGALIVLTSLIQADFLAKLFEPPPPATAPVSKVPPQPRYYDTTIRPGAARELPLDTFVAQADIPAKVDPDATFFPGVKPELLNSVEDFSPMRTGDDAAWFNLMEVLQETDEQKLAKASQGEIGFVQMYEQMDVYRGQLITVRGVVKRAFDVYARKNDQGISKYYQLWLFPEGGPISPIVINCLELPEDFPLSRTDTEEIKNINEKVTLTGFAFKNWVYGAGPDSQRIESAPLLLAKTVDWQKPVVEIAQPVPWKTIGLVVALTAIGAIAFTIYVYISSNQLGAKSSPALAHLSAGSKEEVPQTSAEVAATLQMLDAQSAEAAKDEETRDDMDSSPSPPTDENLS